MAEYAITQGIDHEPVFNWWVSQVLWLRKCIISLVKKWKKRYLKKNLKFGIKVPTSVDHAFAIDKQNGNTLWADTIGKELKDVRIAFKCLNPGERPPLDYKWIKCHMIFDIKIKDFRRKARMVAGGHMTGAPRIMTYASVVSRESIRITLTIAALNDLEVKASDILNAYISAPIKEKVWCALGPEFGPDAGKSAICPRTLWPEECWCSIPCQLGRLHATPWLLILSCQPGSVVQRGETTSHWGIVLLLHFDLC